MKFSPQEILDLTRNEPPLSFAQDIIIKVAAAYGESAHLYPSGDLLPATEAAMCRFFSRDGRIAKLFRGVDDCVDHVLEHGSALTPLVFSPTFPGFSERLKASGRDYDVAELGCEHRFHDSLLEKLRSHHLVLLANPANPTGTIWPHSVIFQIAAKVAMVFVDEAYINFSSNESFELVAPDNVVVYRSFSKAHCLAALRLGVLLGGHSLVTAIRAAWPRMAKIQERYRPFDSLSLRLLNQVVTSSVADTCASAVIANRRELVSILKRHNLQVTDTEANFVLIKPCVNGRDVAQMLAEGGIAVRRLDDVGLPGWLRMSVPSSSGLRRIDQHLSTFSHEKRDCRST